MKNAVCAVERVALVIVLVSLPLAAQAQRASENVVTSAQDAFGASIGEDSVGLYSDNEARGFSPKDAGNMRIEGLFYDQQRFFGFGDQLVQSIVIRVGLSAQTDPFPAPTGIADIRLRLPGDETITSISADYGPYGSSYSGQVDLETPLIDGKLGTVLSFAVKQSELDFHGVYYSIDFSALMHWTPRDNTEFISFIQQDKGFDSELKPLIFMGGAFLPPKIDRSVFFGQDWAKRKSRTQRDYGVIARSLISRNWRIQIGAFRSYNGLASDFAVFYRNTQPDGTADLEVRARPPPKLGSYSGEVRASGVFSEGPRRHTVNLSARGRLVRRTFGGDDTVSFGTAPIGVFAAVPEPTFNLGPESVDKVRQGTLGVSYVTLWQGIGKISAGLQKSFYQRKVDQPNLPLVTSRTSPWFYSGSAAAYLNDDLTLYASYTRGLEESGIAPENASNPGEALPASLTEQLDAGLRYKITPDLTLIAAVFEISKPFFDRDPTNIFTRVGSLRHRGVELSLSGHPFEGLKIVTGAMFLQARVSGTTVDQGLIGSVPPGRVPMLIRFNADYGPAVWRGFSVNANISYDQSHYADRINTLRISPSTTLDVGVRYNFEIFDSTASIRLDAKNITNVYIWTVHGSSGQYQPTAPRRVIAKFAIDF